MATSPVRPPVLYVDNPRRAAIAFVVLVLLFAAAVWGWMVVLGL